MKKLFLAFVFLFTLNFATANNEVIELFLETNDSTILETTLVSNDLTFNLAPELMKGKVNCELVGNITESVLTMFNSDLGLTEEQIEGIGNLAEAVCDLIQSL